MSSETEISVITAEGSFSHEYEDFCRKLNGTNDGAFVCVSVFGPQSSGKSTLLNDLFETNFKTMNLSTGRNQTTKGIMARTVGFPTTVTSQVLILDCEGSDSRERNQQDSQSIERHIGCFAAAVSDLLIINIWNHDIGRHSAANYNVLSTIFDIYFKSLLNARQKSGNHRPLILLIAIRDAEEDGADIIQKTFESDVHHIYEQSVPKIYHDSFDEYFCLQFWLIPHRKYMRSLYNEKISQLRTAIKETFISLVDTGTEDALMPLADTYIYYTNVWNTVSHDKDLDIPSQREIVSNLRCEEIYSETWQRFSSQISKISADVIAATQTSLNQEHSSFLDQSIDNVAVKDYPIARIHNTCNSLKLTRALLDISKEAVDSYYKRTRHYILRISGQWSSRLNNDISSELQKVTHTFAKCVREATCHVLHIVTTPFQVQITQWLDRHEFSDDYAYTTNTVDILLPELITDLTLPEKRLTDLICLLGAETRVFHKCVSVNWTHEYSTLCDTGIFVNAPLDNTNMCSRVPINETPAATDYHERLSVGYEASDSMDGPVTDSEAVLSNIKHSGMYSSHLCAFLESVSLSAYGQALSLTQMPTMVPEITNAYDAICLLHTIILLWYCETMLPLSIIYYFTPEIDRIIPESNALFCTTMGTILTTVTEAVSSQTRIITASMAQATARRMDDKLYVTLGSLRGVIYESARKVLERSLFSLLSSEFVAPDHQGLLYLQTRLSSPTVHFSLYSNSDCSSKEPTDSFSHDAPNPVYKQYTDIYSLVSSPSLLPTVLQSHDSVCNHLSSGSSNSDRSPIPRYRAAPIIAVLDISVFYIPQAAILLYMNKIDVEIIELINKSLAEFFSKSLPSVLQNNLRSKLIYDDQGVQRSYFSEDSISTEFLAIKNSLVSMAQMFESGSLITENLHSVTIKPVSQDKISTMLREAETGWENIYDEALEIYHTSKHRDRYKWVWLCLCVLLVFIRRWIYTILLNKYCLYAIILILSIATFIYKRTTPGERSVSFSTMTASIRDRNAKLFWSAAKDLAQKAIR